MEEETASTVIHHHHYAGGETRGMFFGAMCLVALLGLIGLYFLLQPYMAIVIAFVAVSLLIVAVGVALRIFLPAWERARISRILAENPLVHDEVDVSYNETFYQEELDVPYEEPRMIQSGYRGF